MTVDPTTKITPEEIEEFGQAFKYAPEPDCQVKTEFHLHGECEHEVTYWLRTCRGAGFACVAAVRSVQDSIRKGLMCATCGLPCASDWRYYPI